MADKVAKIYNVAIYRLSVEMVEAPGDTEEEAYGVLCEKLHSSHANSVVVGVTPFPERLPFEQRKKLALEELERKSKRLED